MHRLGPKPLSLLSTDAGAMWIGGDLTMVGGDLTMNKTKLSITHATAKIGGTCHGILSGHLRHSCQMSAHGLRSAAAELYRAFRVIPPWVSFPVARSIVSEVAFGSVVMGFLKMQWPPSTSATRHVLVGRPSSCHDVSSRRHPIPPCFLD